MVLESNQFNQLVEEVKKALLVGSQGVGDVEIVDSLADIVSPVSYTHLTLPTKA